MMNKSPQKTKTEPVKEHCPDCNGERSCDVRGHIYVPWHWEDKYHGYSTSGGVDHSLLQCRGCEGVFYLHDSWNEEDLDHWYDHNGVTQTEAVRTKITYPKPDSTTKPVWLDAIGKVDTQLRQILEEMYVARDNEAFILTAVGLRTALDRGTEVLGIHPSKTFAEKLQELKDGGWIGETEHKILEVITDAGNAAAHRGWVPEAKQIADLLYAMEVFLQRAFLVSQKALSIKENIPPKPKGPKAKKAK